MPAPAFGEGIAVWKDDPHRADLAIATSRSSTTARPSSRGSTFTYPAKGWGLTHDGARLIMSDGSDELRFLDPVTFAEKRRIKVTARGRAAPAI